VLSLLGAFGLNQNSLNSNANSIPTETVENIQNIEDNQSLSGDNQTNVAEANAPAAEVKVNDVANDKENKKDIKDSKTVVNEKVQNTGTKNSKTDSNAKAADVKVQNTNNAVQKADKTNTQLSANNQTKAEATPVASSNNNVNNNSNQSSIKNGQVYYENINLSNCKSTSDVVKVLNNNGYQNITVDNIKKLNHLRMYWIMLIITIAQKITPQLIMPIIQIIHIRLRPLHQLSRQAKILIQILLLQMPEQIQTQVIQVLIQA